MKTPNRVTLEEAKQARDVWGKEFLGAERQMWDALPPHFCRKCGSLILQKLTYISIHLAEFEYCSGSGHVERLPIPFCPSCEPEPESYGCLHVPRGKTAPWRGWMR
jgi:hypothetical protein